MLLLIQKVPALIFKHQLEPQNVKKRKRQSIGVWPYLGEESFSSSWGSIHQDVSMQAFVLPGIPSCDGNVPYTSLQSCLWDPQQSDSIQHFSQSHEIWIYQYSKNNETQMTHAEHHTLQGILRSASQTPCCLKTEENRGNFMVTCFSLKSVNSYSQELYLKSDSVLFF